jgi:putative transcriptional regulator
MKGAFMKRIKLKLKRVEKDLTQEQLAKLIGLSRVSYVHIENGEQNPSYETWGKIQAVLEIKDEEMWGVVKGE